MMPSRSSAIGACLIAGSRVSLSNVTATCSPSGGTRLLGAFLPHRLTDGGYLAVAIACRWLSSLTYVFCAGGGDDNHPYLMEGFDKRADNIRLAALTMSQIHELLDMDKPEPLHWEPPVPFHALRWEGFQATEPFDAVFLARSPEFTPEAADEVFDAIRETFIDEATFG